MVSYIHKFYQSFSGMPKVKADTEYFAQNILAIRDDQKLALAGSIAHEMRNPLNKVLLIADLLQEKYARNKLDAAAMQQIIKLMQTTVQDANQVIDLILGGLSHQNIDKTDFHHLSVAQNVREALQLYPFQSGERQIIRVHVEQDFTIFASPTLLHYVLFNLLKNALYYLPQHPDMRIDISIKCTGSLGYLLFRDTAVGIANDEIDNIFASFATAGKQGGTGLGLLFCKWAIECFHGSMDCTAKPGVYTLFTIALPVRACADTEADTGTTEQAASEVATPAQDLSTTPETSATNINALPRQKPGQKIDLNKLRFAHKTILLIEDEPTGRMLMQSLIGSIQGIHLHLAEDGAQALRQIALLKPDMILADLNLPDLSGLQLINAIEKCLRGTAAKTLRNKPLLISLSATDPEPVVRAKLDDTLIKPVSRDDVLAKLIQYLHPATASS